MGLKEFLDAKALLESVGLQVVDGDKAKINEALGQDEIVVTVKIHYENTTTADERTKEGRHTFHRLKGAYGIHESEDTDHYKMGGQKIGMFKKDSEKVNFSWTWLDVNKFKQLVEENFGVTGLGFSEQHGQTDIKKEVDDEPVSTGNFDQDGPYGAGSASIWYFTMKMDRTWQIKLTGSSETIAKILDAPEVNEKFERIAKESMPAWGEYQKLKTEPGHYVTMLNRKIPDVYEVNVSIK